MLAASAPATPVPVRRRLLLLGHRRRPAATRLQPPSRRAAGPAAAATSARPRTCGGARFRRGCGRGRRCRHFHRHFRGHRRQLRCHDGDCCLCCQHGNWPVAEELASPPPPLSMSPLKAANSATGSSGSGTDLVAAAREALLLRTKADWRRKQRRGPWSVETTTVHLRPRRRGNAVRWPSRRARSFVQQQLRRLRRLTSHRRSLGCTTACAPHHRHRRRCRCCQRRNAVSGAGGRAA